MKKHPREWELVIKETTPYEGCIKLLPKNGQAMCFLLTDFKVLDI